MIFFKRLLSKIPIRVTKAGLIVDRLGDSFIFLWIWWDWKKFSFRKTLSSNYALTFTSFEEYREYCNRQSVADIFAFRRALYGYSTLSLLQVLIEERFPLGFYVIFYDMDLNAKPSDFWKKIPSDRAKAFLKDTCVISCKDMSEVSSICRSTDPTFASVVGWGNGAIVDWNVNYDPFFEAEPVE